MQDCMSQYPALYNKQTGDDDDDDSPLDKAFDQSGQETIDTSKDVEIEKTSIQSKSDSV